MAGQKPSLTAFLIPKVIPALSHVKRYKPLVTREQVNLSRRFANEFSKNLLVAKLLHNLVRGTLPIWAANKLSVRGLAAHIALRKRYIRKKLDSVAGEVKQVVMLGAGFDTLCLEYYSEYPNINFFELDLGANQSIKLQALNKIPQYDKRDNLHFIECDLSKNELYTVLESDKAFDKSAATFFIIEGVLMYLQNEDVEKLFKQLSIAQKGSYAVFGSVSELKPEKDNRSKVSDAMLAASKEKYGFAATKEEIVKLLGRAGYELLDNIQYHELQKEIESPEEVEKISRERGEHYYFAVKK